ncbi:MAG: membrane associated rhomboid family serine protease [Candidatus Krumholzibacteriia bacterium]|jgi:membrane associated rhomboid family serine protease
MVLMTVAFLWLKYFPSVFAFSPWELVFYAGDGAPWTVTTAIFMHTSWFHLLGNLIYFYVFAPPLEDRLGSWKFGLYFLLLGNFGNLIHGLVSALDLLGQGGLGVMGASGAIAGMLSFSLVRFYNARVEVAWWVLAPLAGQNKAGKTRIPLAAAVGLWLLLQVVHTMMVHETGAQVSFGAHLGGFAMGLLMALSLGGLREGRAEAAEYRARRYFQAGHYHAAVGAWCEYIALEPNDWPARLDMARAMKITGQTSESTAVFRDCFVHMMRAGRVDEALRIYDETYRSGADLELSPEQLNKVALYKEKQLDYPGALEAYRRLFKAHPEHPKGQRALVRVIVLYHGKVADPEAAKHWLEEAFHSLPPGTWRSFLASEFKLPTELCATLEPGLR